MANDDRVLSQDEIDALLSSALTRGNTPPKAPPPSSQAQQVKVSAEPPPPKVVEQQPKAPSLPPPPKGAAALVKPPAPAPVQPPVASPPGMSAEQVSGISRKVVVEETQDIQKTLIELTIKVNKLSDAAQRMDQLEEKIDQLTALVKSSPKAVRALGARIDELYGLIAAIQQHSDEDRIHEEFYCVNCRSKKMVAIHVKCTSCGTENWIGWFPESKGKGIGEGQE